MNKKIMVVGTSGSGKSTLARILSKMFHIPHIELDTLYWEKNWSVNSKFRKVLEQKLVIPEWIICGNYSKIEDLTWSQASIVLWLDYPFYLIFWRAFKRSIQHIYTQEKVCGGNVETIQRLFSKNSILLWVIQTYFKRKRAYQALMSQENSTPKMIRIKSPKELNKVLLMLQTVLK